ncbi:rod shape-determining protein MreC [Novosphingobium nitrogenifigens DSM 19370]|uniref:Cell shape-determining protein MreC n=1 Tax=Novosphingobium nitrogenifigens DSM 19370 TaxID=983920 RepID=F1Z908_9SPHN|nr:rod shape-determining protein MreC [Novosphingobium nitrogenifigens]EGD58831.1 rod shape-determining protein MreC [Novosphingobium nitrogenifigens DSM 19370]
MARSRDLRPGYSRRAQYGIFTGYVVAIVGVVAGLVVLGVSLIHPEAFSFLRSAGSEIAAPVGEASATARNSGRGLLATIGAYFDAGHQNLEFTREIAAARADAVTMRAVQEENRRLKALLGIVDPAAPPVVAARLIGSTAASARRYAVLDAGSGHGVHEGQPVRAAGGLVGRVVETSPDTARVLLISDADNVVPVRRASDGLPGFVQGSANGKIAIRLLTMGTNPLHTGDIFVTSGSGGIYPPGIPVAIVSVPQRDGAEGRLAADPAATDYVVVLPVYKAPAVAAMADSLKAAGPPPKDDN